MVFLCESFLLLVAFNFIAGGIVERDLYRKLLADYETLARPVANDSDAVVVTLGLTLQQIIDIDEKNQIMQTNIWLVFKWNDYRLKWNPAEHNGIDQIRLPPSRIWKPDILLYNSVDENFDSSYPANTVVRSDGSIEWLPPGIVKSTCKIDITWFPFDEQRCELKYGSWTYSGVFLRLVKGEVDNSTFVTNGEWHLVGKPSRAQRIIKLGRASVGFTEPASLSWSRVYLEQWRPLLDFAPQATRVEEENNVEFIPTVDVNTTLREFMYDCCPEPYYDIIFTIWVRRRTLYYGFNFIIPCLLISLMTMLDFILPPESGEKLTLGITIFMSLCVFLLMVAEAMPPTSDSVPLIGTYFSCIMIVVSASQVLTVLVLNIHYRNPKTHVMSPLMKLIFLNWLPWLLLMQRPGYRNAGKRLIKIDDFEEEKRKQKAQLVPHVKPRWLSKSLLANVMDVDDMNALLSRSSSMRDSGASARSGRFSNYALSDVQEGSYCDNNNEDDGEFEDKGERIVPVCACSCKEVAAATVPLLQVLDDIWKDVRYIAKRMQIEDEEKDIVDDWKFAAMVLDRLSLIVFTTILVVSTCAIIFAAPQIMV